MEFTGADKTCSFCGVAWAPEGDQRLAGGFGAQICAGCIDRYHSAFADDRGYEALRRNPWEGMSKEQLLEHLPDIQRTSRQVDDFLHGWVGLLRARNVSWQEIGLALGVSRQAAWERFTRGRRAARRPAADPG